MPPRSSGAHPLQLLLHRGLKSNPTARQHLLLRKFSVTSPIPSIRSPQPHPVSSFDQRARFISHTSSHPACAEPPIMSQIERITERLERPELDDRSYRVIRLPNQLEALLVHDPDTDKASAAVNVNVGNFSDEDDMPGMAHAVEHLLFMGTKKVGLGSCTRSLSPKQASN